MSNDQFRKTEEEFFRLKGQATAGRITQEQFDAALKQLMFHDAQGRYWMIGADSGKWYVHDGRIWVEAIPSVTSTPLVTESYTPKPQPAKGINRVVWFAMGCAVLVCILSTLGVGLAINQGIVKISIDSILTPTSAPKIPIVPTPTPRSNTLVVPSPTTIPPSPIAPTWIAPTVTVVVAPPTATALTTNTPMPTPTATLSPPTPVPPSPTAPIPPGLYVTRIRLEPPNPNPNQEVGFYVTFINTASGTQNYRWIVYIYKADNLRNSLGETSSLSTSIPVGTVEQKALGVWKTGIGTCGSYIARAAWLDENKKATPFITPNGQMYELPFNVCQ